MVTPRSVLFTRRPRPSGGRPPPTAARARLHGRLTHTSGHWAGRPRRVAPESGGEPGDLTTQLASRLGDAARDTAADLDKVAADVFGRLDGAPRGPHHRRGQLAADLLGGAQRFD